MNHPQRNWRLVQTSQHTLKSSLPCALSKRSQCHYLMDRSFSTSTPPALTFCSHSHPVASRVTTHPQLHQSIITNSFGSYRYLQMTGNGHSREKMIVISFFFWLKSASLLMSTRNPSSPSPHKGCCKCELWFFFLHAFLHILNDSQQMLQLVKEASISSRRSSRMGPWDQQFESSMWVSCFHCHIASWRKPLQLVVRKGMTDILDNLRIKYPIGTDSGFPGKHVYSSGPDALWELTALRLQVWASHIVCIYKFVLQYYDLTFLSRLREQQPLMNHPTAFISLNLRGSKPQQRQDRHQKLPPHCQSLPKLPQLSPISHPTKDSTLSVAILLTSHPHILTHFIHLLVMNQILPHIQTLPCKAMFLALTQMPQPLSSPPGPTSTQTLWELNLTLQVLCVIWHPVGANFSSQDCPSATCLPQWILWSLWNWQWGSCAFIKTQGAARG